MIHGNGEGRVKTIDHKKKDTSVEAFSGSVDSSLFK